MSGQDRLKPALQQLTALQPHDPRGVARFCLPPLVARQYTPFPMTPPRTSRRNFLAQSAAVLGFPTIIPATALGKGRPAPSNRITVGVFGWGTIAGDWTPSFLNNEKCQVVAVADPMKESGGYGYDGSEL